MSESCSAWSQKLMNMSHALVFQILPTMSVSLLLVLPFKSESNLSKSLHYPKLLHCFVTRHVLLDLFKGNVGDGFFSHAWHLTLSVS